MFASEIRSAILYSFGGAVIGAFVGYYLVKKTKHELFDLVLEEPEPQGTNYRLIMGVRTDLKMQKGKVAAQCGHAAVAAYMKAQEKRPRALKQWIKYGQAKIAVKIEDETEMFELRRQAKQAGISTCVIQDAGHTQVAPGSATVIAFGPAPKSDLDKITGHLKLF